MTPRCCNFHLAPCQSGPHHRSYQRKAAANPKSTLPPIPHSPRIPFAALPVARHPLASILSTSPHAAVATVLGADESRGARWLALLVGSAPRLACRSFVFRLPRDQKLARFSSRIGRFLESLVRVSLCLLVFCVSACLVCVLGGSMRQCGDVCGVNVAMWQCGGW